MFRPFTMNKSELARLYFPESTTHVAVNHLMAWIERCSPLRGELSSTGYRKSQRLFTSRQVKIIVEHLGEP